VGLLIDPSTPAIATQTTGTITTCTTASFTPPDGALLLVRWAGNSHSATNPNQPTITDSLGTPLTYTLLDWQSKADSPSVSGQAASWYAVVGSSAAMTVTVTNNMQGSSNERHAALHVTVFTGQDTVVPVGAHGKSGSASASSISQSYTAQDSGGWGLIATCDWDDMGAETAGTGCTLTDGGSGSIAGFMSYGFVRRNSDDDVIGNSNTLNVNLPGTSTNLAWVYAEVLPLAIPDDPLPPYVFSLPPYLILQLAGYRQQSRAAVVAPTPGTLLIDASTPAIATQTNGTIATVTTASFTPPTGSLLLIRWASNSNSGINPGAPSVTDNLGVHLTYTQTDWQSRADSPTLSGQVAAWWATVGTSAPMTVTVTGDGSGSNHQAALHVTVLTGYDTVTPIGAHGKTGSASASAITQSYTAQADGAQGFVAVCDWDALGDMVAGNGCTLTDGGTGTVPTTQISYGFLRRIAADDVNAVSNTLNVTLPKTSTNLSWAYVEVRPFVAAAQDFSVPWALPRRGRLLPLVVRRGGRAVSAPPAQAVVTAPAYPPRGVSRRIKGALARRPGMAMVVPPQSTPAAPTTVIAPVHARAKAIASRRRITAVTPLEQDTPVQFARPRLRPVPPRRRIAAATPPAQSGVWQTVRARVKAILPRRRQPAMVVPVQTVVTAPVYPPQSVRTRLKGTRLARGRVATVVPAQASVTPPAYVPQGLRSRIRSVRLFRPRAAAPIPTQATPVLAYVPGRARQAVLRQATARRGHAVSAPLAQTVPPVFVRLRLRITRWLRSWTRAVVPAQVILIAPGYPPRPTRARRVLFKDRRHRASVDGWMTSGVTCVTPLPSTGSTVRPNTGTTAYALAYTARPNTGMTAPGDTGSTSDPC
jgi:hypothetical protein